MICVKLFLVFFVTGIFTIGGGYAMIPMITELLGRYGWATIDEITDFIAISESTPGPFAVNIATMVGFRQGGVLGSFLAVLGVVLPSIIIILLIIIVFKNAKKGFLTENALRGVLPTVSGLIISAGLMTLVKSGTIYDVKGMIIFLLIGALCIFKKPHPILVVAISAVLGLIFY